MQQVQAFTQLAIRSFAADDYSAIARLFTRNFPEFAFSAEEWRFDEASRPTHCRLARWIAEWDGRTVGYGQYEQHPSVYHPRKFQLDVVVDPAFFGRGIGRHLYDVVLGEVGAFEPLTVDAWSREDMPCRVGFFERRGFVENMRLWTSTLDLATFASTRFGDRADALEAQGMQIRTLAELGPTDRDVQRRLYELWLDVRRDVPHPPNDALVEVPFEQYAQRFERPYLWPAGYFVAVDGDQYVGLSELSLSPEADTLRTGLTGVRRSHRRRGIALALKIRSLEFGKAQGFARVLTENELNNQGMLAINDQLGFVKNPAWLHYFKAFETQA